MIIRTISRARARGDEGVALVVAVAVMALAAAMMITMTMIMFSDNKQTGRDRDRSVSINYAEGGVDTALAQIQNASVGSIPCGTTTRTATNAAPETVTITTTVTYFDSSGTALSCAGSGGLLSTQYAAQAQVKAVATSTPRLGGQPVQRTMEALVSLKPTYANDLNRAIFGQAGVVVTNNFDLYGQNGPDADVYTNGDFSCTNSEHIRGSIYSQGTITLNGPCTVDSTAWSKNGFASTDSHVYVGGDVQVSNGNANISQGTIGGKVKAVTITPASFCQNSPSKCVTGSNAAPPPPAVGYPQLGNDTAPWVANGYVVANNGSYLDNCSNTSASDNPGNWIVNHASTLSSKTVLLTHCTLFFPQNAKNINLKQDLAIFASGGIDLENSLDFASTDSTKHYIYFIQPYNSVTSSSPCGTYTTQQGNQLGIWLGNLVTMESTVSELLYTPCDIHKENQSSTYGQVYAGGTVYIDNKSSAFYVPIPVFGAVTTKIVLWYTADILYKRETVG